MSDGVRKSTIELDAESVQISIHDEVDNASKPPTNIISFSDIYKAYRAVPQDRWIFLLRPGGRYDSSFVQFAPFCTLRLFYSFSYQTLEELNERDSKQLEKLHKMEFQQIVSQLEEARRNETDMMKKILSYSNELANNGTFIDYEETSFPDLFVY